MRSNAILFLLCIPALLNAECVVDSKKRTLNFPDHAIPISQSDFSDGPYRIKTPGYYYLTEDISFDQNGGRTADRPRTGAWFAAVSIECDNVVLDLNTYTLECTQNFILRQDFKVFSLIELNNSPFQHLIFAYGDATELKVAHNVEIKNGKIGRSSHHGIHGNLNTNVYLHDLVIRDWEVAAIGLNGAKNTHIKDISISGIEHNVAFTGLVAVEQSALQELKKLIVNDADIQAKIYYDALSTMTQSSDPNQSGRGHMPANHDGNCYGIFLNRTVDVGPLPTGHCDDGTINSITIENVTICNILTSVIETVGMLNANGERMKSIPFGTLRWMDAYAGLGSTFKPNALLKAQAYVMKKNPTLVPVAVPAGFVDNILSNNPSEALFLTQVTPGFSGDFATHTTKGAFGIRVDCGHGITLRNCKVYNIQAKGAEGATLSSLPGGNNYPNYQEIRYKGNDVHGITLVACRNCVVDECSTYECMSDHGYVYGIMVANESEGNLITNAYSSDHYAAQDDVTSSVNPSARVYGVYVSNKCAANRFNNIRTQLLKAPRYAYGVWIDSSSDTQFLNCNSVDHSVTATTNLQVGKEVVGFLSQASYCSLFQNCYASNMYCENEFEDSFESHALAAGFILRSDGTTKDKYSTITESYARCCNGGAGVAVGIRLDGTSNAGITDNHAITSHGDIEDAKGYGIQDLATNCQAMILRNIAYGNSTSNYAVNYTDKRSLPLYIGLHTARNDIKYNNSWEESLANREIIN